MSYNRTDCNMFTDHIKHHSVFYLFLCNNFKAKNNMILGNYLFVYCVFDAVVKMLIASAESICFLPELLQEKLNLSN